MGGWGDIFFTPLIFFTPIFFLHPKWFFQNFPNMSFFKHPNFRFCHHRLTFCGGGVLSMNERHGAGKRKQYTPKTHCDQCFLLKIHQNAFALLWPLTLQLIRSRAGSSYSHVSAPDMGEGKTPAPGRSRATRQWFSQPLPYTIKDNLIHQPTRLSFYIVQYR